MFTGREYDAETGLYYYRARYYSPDIGRFLQVDPFDYMDGSNVYKYVRNNPINLADPWGYKPEDKYQMQDDAGSEALKDAYLPSVSRDREYGGYVYKNSDGTYSYTPPKEGKQHSTTDLGSKPSTTTADYHTHGAESGPNYGDEEFSPADKQDNRNKGLTGYLGTPSGDIKKYNPATQSPEDEGVKIGDAKGKREGNARGCKK